MKPPLTVSKVLDNWTEFKIGDISYDVSDSDIWSMARLAAIIAGKRAQDIGNEKYEAACVRFVKSMDGFIRKT